jgi:hypothetical protein
VLIQRFQIVFGWYFRDSAIKSKQDGKISMAEIVYRKQWQSLWNLQISSCCSV